MKKLTIIGLLLGLTFCSIFREKQTDKWENEYISHYGAGVVKDALGEAQGKIKKMDKLSNELNHLITQANGIGKKFNSIVNGKGLVNTVTNGVKGLFDFKLYDDNLKYHTAFSLGELKKQTQKASNDINQAKLSSDKLKKLTDTAKSLVDKAMGVLGSMF